MLHAPEVATEPSTPEAPAPQPPELPGADAPLATWRDVIARFELDETATDTETTGEGVPWEVEAMTTPDYAGRRPAEPAAPATPDEFAHEVEAPTIEEGTEGLEEIEDLLAGDTGRRSDFPLDAFIVPAGVPHPPAGYESSLAHLVADRLEELAAHLRRDGLSALGSTHDAGELSRVLAAIVAGYVTRGE